MQKSDLSMEFSRNKKPVKIYLLSIITGIISGLIVVLYRMAISFIIEKRTIFLEISNQNKLLYIVFFVLVIAVSIITAFLVKKAPHIKGSGIPQVKANLMKRMKFLWKQELPFKFLGGTLALGAGMSLGREGPSIQLGALAGTAVADLTKNDEAKHHLVTAGAAAGISAAFNAPFAGIIFCLEELHKNFSPVMLTSSLIASLASNIVMWLFYGKEPVFRLVLGQELPLALYLPCILVIGLLTGISGIIFNSGLVFFQKLQKKLIKNETLRIIIAFIIAAIVSIFYPIITGGGDSLIEVISEHKLSVFLLLSIFVFKFIFTLFCYGSGAPGGIFLPMLSIGALIGSLAGILFTSCGIAPGYETNYILLGMVGFFVAVVRAPITGAILITEMAGSFSHFPSFIAVSIIATIVASVFGGKPIYDILLKPMITDDTSDNHSRPIIENFTVFEGSVLDLCGNAQKALPKGCVLVGIDRGEEELYPEEELDIIPGDILRIVIDSAHEKELRSKVMQLANSPDLEVFD